MTGGASGSARRASRGAAPRGGDPAGAVPQAPQYLGHQSETLLDLANAHPDARIDVARGQHRHLEFKPIVGRIGVRLARLKSPAAGPADGTAGAHPGTTRGGNP